MAEFSFTCEFCDKPISADTAQVGQDIPCVHCGEIVTVPRQREKLALKRPSGGGGAGGAGLKPSAIAVPRGASDNLTSLTNVKVFGDDRAAIQSRKRNLSFLWQILAALIILGILGGGIAVALRLQARKEAKLQQDAKVAAERAARTRLLEELRREAVALNSAAREKNPYWKMSDDDCRLFWVALNDEVGNRAFAKQEFENWVALDGKLYGVLAEQYDAVRKGENLGEAMMLLRGMAFALYGEPTPSLTWIETFKRFATMRLPNAK